MARSGFSAAGTTGVGGRQQRLPGGGVPAALSPVWTPINDISPFDDAAGMLSATGDGMSSLDQLGASADDHADLIKPWRFLSLVEIANFQALRRHLGAPRADRLVLDVADRLSLCLPGIRIGIVGRRMVELHFEGNSPDDAAATLERVRMAVEEPLNLDGEAHRVELWLGVAAAPIGRVDDVRLAEEAEHALADSRVEGGLVVRDLGSDAPVFDRNTLVRDLEKAVERGEMFLQYQPKVHLRRQEIASVEALVRWQHPTRGLILPGDFIPFAEEARQIGPLTLWTIDQVIEDQKKLAAQGHDLTVFVNISGQLLGDPAFVARACQIVRGGGAKIGFEITETSVIRDPETAINHLQVFAEMNIPIAIDDYGAGLSSLAYLKQLPASELKIDKMFVVQLTSSNRDPLIVRSTIDLAHALDMEVTAEGVETQASLALLSVMGCDMVQGFLISRPVCLDALIQYLDEERHLAATVNPRASFNRADSFWKRA